MSTLLIAVALGGLIGLSLGTLGAGGSILAVPVLVHLLGQSPAQATTGALVVVGVSSFTGVLAARRHGTVMLTRGLVFAAVAVAGTTVGAIASSQVDEQLLLTCFGAVMLLVGISMAVRARRRGAGEGEDGFDSPVVGFRPTFHVEWPRAITILLTATVVGMLTGFLGVGGGFLVVPALVLALGLPMRNAAATSMVVITITSATALIVRSGTGIHPDWDVVAALTAATAVATVVGSRLAGRLDRALLHRGFTVLVLALGLFVLADSLTTHLT